MTDGGFMSDLEALRGVLPTLRQRADAGAADYGMTAVPDAGRSTDETGAALAVLDAAMRQAGSELTSIADSLQSSISAYEAQDAAAAARLTGMVPQ